MEHLRWYDYWLKGINNGIMDEPPFYYYTIGAPPDLEWRSTSKWPLPNEKPTDYYFSAGTSGSVNSANDGTLSTTQPGESSGKDNYTVDYSVTTGSPDPIETRWTAPLGAQVFGKAPATDLSSLDEKGLTYTTSPLQQAVEVTGHPVLHLWVTSTASDGDFYVYLEDIDENGV